MYPHSREVLNIDANRNYSAYTDPITIIESSWIEEILTSPNVWIVTDNARSQELNDSVATGNIRPSGKGYVPVLITNSSTTLVNEEERLVQMQIDFTESNPINTQRN